MLCFIGQTQLTALDITVCKAFLATGILGDMHEGVIGKRRYVYLLYSLQPVTMS